MNRPFVNTLHSLALLPAFLLLLPLPPASAASAEADAAKAAARKLDSSKPTPVPLPVETLDLGLCYQLALLRMESIGLSEADVRVAQARFWQAVGAALPTLKVLGEQSVYNDRSASFGVNNSGGGIGGPAPKIDNYPQTARVNLKVPLFSGMRDFQVARAARADIEGNRQTIRRVRQNLYLDVAEAFYQVLQYEDDLRVLGDIEQTLLERVADQERRVKLGKSRQSELIQARNDLAQARVSLERTRGLHGASRELLLFYTGLPEEQLKIKDTAPPPPGSLTLAHYLEKSGQRPDVLAAVEAERSARAQLSAAKGEHWPTLSFEGNYYLYDSDKIQDGEWNGFLTLEIPIFDGGSIEARVDENKALFAKKQLDVSKLERETVRDIRTAWNNFNSSLAELARTDEAARTAEMNYTAQKADYELGVVKSLDVLDALRSWQDTRRDLIAAHLASKLNLVKLHVAAGDIDQGPLKK
ncbi:MAG: TolC family protein [Candidatus Methylacidiphilales bacterium]|nr:TolC family protein [Candidatus Methylacidiphilales bacterium]